MEYLRKEKYAVVTIPRSKKGLDLVRLEEIFKTKEIKFFISFLVTTILMAIIYLFTNEKKL